eukprot:10285863-Karenia_brevis.AAC.1
MYGDKNKRVQDFINKGNGDALLARDIGAEFVHEKLKEEICVETFGNEIDVQLPKAISEAVWKCGIFGCDNCGNNESGEIFSEADQNRLRILMKLENE